MKLEDLPSNEYFSGWATLLPGSDHNIYGSVYSGTYSVYDGAQVADVTAERIARVDGFWADGGDWAETNVVALVELTDGTWAACMAWCDTTGWDCQSGAAWKWARTRDEAISQGLDKAARAHLDLSLPNEND